MITHRVMAFEILTAFVVLLLLLVENQRSLMVQAFGYSYSRFIGPVRGPERQIIVHDRHDGRGRLDYVARPEYQFAYGVEDAKTRVLQNRRETRNGDAVKGVYSVVDPDGSLRVVKYTADNVNGFQAEVISNGVSTNHGQDNPVVVHPDPQQLADGDGGNAPRVNAKDETKPLQPHQHIQVQHPENSPPPPSHEREATGGVKKIPAVEEVNNESSDSRDASDYQEEADDDVGDDDVANGDGGRSSESRNESQEKDDGDDDSSEEVEDY